MEIFEIPQEEGVQKTEMDMGIEKLAEQTNELSALVAVANLAENDDAIINLLERIKGGKK